MNNLINRFLIVDGSSYLYRAYHAMIDLKNSQGMHTGALYGLVSMLRKLKDAYPSTYCACVFDDKEKTFRHHLYDQYKANRPPMPQQLVEQLAHVDELVKSLGWLVMRIAGVEADDIMGTLARHAQVHMPVLIATGDKDMAQLVNDKIHLIDTMKNTYMDIEGVKGKFDLEPRQIIDYLALMGDTSDNVPGIEKVGPKTAVKWLKEYDNLENIVANADKFTGVVGENLRKGLQWLDMSKTLVTIKIDCEPEIEEKFPQWQTWRLFLNKDENTPILKELFTKFEFKGWLKDIEKKESQQNAQNDNIKDKSINENDLDNHLNQENLISFTDILIDKSSYKTIQNIEELKLWLEKLNQAGNNQQIVSLDTETTSLNPMQAELVGISMAMRKDSNLMNNYDNNNKLTNEAVYIPIHANQQGLGNEALELLKSWLENENFAKVGQNIKYDLHIFRNINIEVKGLNDDTMLASYILSSHESHNLDDLARRYLNHQTTSYESVCGKGAKQITFDQVDIAVATNYAAEDADITLHLHHILQQKLQQSKALFDVYKNLECKIAHVLLDIETDGILIDTQELNRQTEHLSKLINEIEQKAFEIAGQNK
jgi:DNA polymerase-1